MAIHKLGKDFYFFIYTPLTVSLEVTLSHNRTKWQDWERIFTNPTSDRGLIYKIYKELKKLDSREPKNPIKMGYSTKQIILN